MKKFLIAAAMMLSLSVANAAVEKGEWTIEYT